VHIYEDAAVFVRNHGHSSTKKEFYSGFREAWMKAATAGSAVRVFRTSGIWPLSIAEIPYILGTNLPNMKNRPAMLLKKKKKKKCQP
jgi:hypothetical protein